MNPIRYHWLRLRATAHATEDVDRVCDAVRQLTGLDDEAFEATCTRTVIEGHFADVVWVESELTRSRDVRTALSRLLPDSEAGRQQLVKELEQRVDDDGVMYLRFEKQAAFEGRIVPTRGEDAVQVRLRVQVHPAGRERAILTLKSLLEAPSL